jgi:hypothetical protein
MNAGTYDFSQMPELFRISCKILAIILKNSEYVHKLDMPEMDMQAGEGDEGEDGKEDNLDIGQGSGSGDGDLEEQVDKDLDMSDSDPRKSKKPSDGKKVTGKVSEKRLKKALDTQKDFVDGNVPKQNIDAETEQQVKAIEQSGAQQVDVEFEAEHSGTRTTRVVVMKNFTREILVSGTFPFTSGYDASVGDGTIIPTENHNAVEAIRDGFRLGRVLAHKLQIRNQAQTTRFNRRETGHIDKKRLHALGHSDKNVFYITRQTEFDPVHVHLTIDGSGSMYGDKFKEALQVGIALAVAADTIENLDVVISIRAGVEYHAAICIVYDSTTDDLSKIRSLFPFLCTAGSTPEGLCFQAILNILTESKATERYFVNLSDGQPAYEGYSGRWAWNHTRDQVNYLRQNDLKILSYYIGGERERAHEGFRIMYGRDAAFINVNQISGLVSTLNKLFLKK